MLFHTNMESFFGSTYIGAVASTFEFITKKKCIFFGSDRFVIFAQNLFNSHAFHTLFIRKPDVDIWV
jgi:hypothetical protein